MNRITELRRQYVPLWERVIERAVGIALVLGCVWLAALVCAAVIAWL